MTFVNDVILLKDFVQNSFTNLNPSLKNAAFTKNRIHFVHRAQLNDIPYLFSLPEPKIEKLG